MGGLELVEGVLSALGNPAETGQGSPGKKVLPPQSPLFPIPSGNTGGSAGVSHVVTSLRRTMSGGGGWGRGELPHHPLPKHTHTLEFVP